MNTQSQTNPLDVISDALKQLAETRTSTDAVFKDIRFLEFHAKASENNYGKGMIFSGDGYAKQFVFAANPDHFFSSENINIAKDKSLYINNTQVISSNALGPSVVKSSLKEVGRLRGLIVDGSVSINQNLFYNANADRLGLGTDSPNAAFGVSENGIEVMLGTSSQMHGIVGTHATADFDIVTDDTPRITVRGNGNIDLGNPTKNPIQVSVHGKLSVGVKNPDPAVDLHVAGAVRFSGHIQMYATETPSAGTYTVGDIVWNSNPSVGRNVGWVCLSAGSPGSWYPFGEIKQRG